MPEIKCPCCGDELTPTERLFHINRIMREFFDDPHMPTEKFTHGIKAILTLSDICTSEPNA